MVSKRGGGSNKNDKWTFPKDSFPQPHIDQLIYTIVGHELVSFYDVYFGYNQIRVDPEDQERTSKIRVDPEDQ